MAQNRQDTPPWKTRIGWVIVFILSAAVVWAMLHGLGPWRLSGPGGVAAP